MMNESYGCCVVGFRGKVDLSLFTLIFPSDKDVPFVAYALVTIYSPNKSHKSLLLHLLIL